jgi:2-polyprenyl-3-methyl-5-hydroxy-6-metoxy-1,4-benzoquinol methylase
MEQVVEYYNQYDEDVRLTIKHKTEFFVTTYFLDNIIKSKNYILDTAAGTGIYSLYYTQHGCIVEAMDIVPRHIKTLKERITPDSAIHANVGDARDLSSFKNDTFDIVLNMGAIYHIEKYEIADCIKETLRVLKPGGHLVIAYINKYKGTKKTNMLINLIFTLLGKLKVIFQAQVTK